MDTPTNPPAQWPWLEISTFVFTVVFVFVAFRTKVFGDGEEESVTFQIPIPEQCSAEWKGEVLEEPTIKVPFPSSTWL